MLECGIVATVNSMAYFDGYADDNFDQLVEVLGPTREEQRTLALNSVEASFIDEGRRVELEAEIEEWFGSV